MSEIEVTGLAGLQALLDELPARIEGNVVRGGLRAAAKVVEMEAKRLCPVGKTGDLRDSIRVTLRSKRGRISATVKAGNARAMGSAVTKRITIRYRTDITAAMRVIFADGSMARIEWIRRVSPKLWVELYCMDLDEGSYE